MKKTKSVWIGAAVLLVANLLVKIIGMGFKIPLHRLLADEGMGYFNAAYNLYVWFFMLSTTGLPVAISTLIAEQHAKGATNGMRAVFRMAMALFCIIGVLGSAGMFLLADFVCTRAEISAAVPSVWVLAPALLFACISGAFRGYFQGIGQMAPTACSQVAEAMGKLVLGILFALYAKAQGAPLATVSAYAISGVTIGSLLSVLVLFLWYLCTYRALSPEAVTASPVRLTGRLWALVRVALPVTLASSVLSMTSVMDTVLLPARLQNGAGYAPQAAVALYGNYTTLAVPLFHMPTVLFSSIACAILPALSAAIATKDVAKKHTLYRDGMRVTVLCALPATLGLAVFAEPILRLLYPAASATLAAPNLSVLAVGVACYGMVTITNAFLQAEGKTWHLLPSAVFGVIVKGACTYLLAGNARFATIAAPIGTVLCYLAIAVWNFAVLRVSLLPVPGLRELFARPFLVATLAVLCGMLWYRTACCFSIAEPVVTLSAVGITGLLYGLFLLLFQCVERQEIADFLPRNVRREKIR